MNKVYNPLVYFISDGEFIKIGTTNNIDQRMRNIRTGNPRQIEVLQIVEHQGVRLERYFQKVFENERVAGEWFDILQDGCAICGENTKDVICPKCMTKALNKYLKPYPLKQKISLLEHEIELKSGSVETAKLRLQIQELQRQIDNCYLRRVTQ